MWIRIFCVFLICWTISSPTDPVQIQVTENDQQVNIRAGDFIITAQLSPWNIKVVDTTTSITLLQDTEIKFNLFDGKDWPIYLGCKKTF